MLLKNPQLAYALLQALVVMRIVDSEMALSMLHKQPPKPMLLGVQQPHIAGGGGGGGGAGGAGPIPAMMDRFNRMDQVPPPSNYVPDMGRGMPEEPRGFGGGRDPRSRDPREHRDPRAGGSRRDPRDCGPPQGGAGEVGHLPPGIPPQLASSDPDKTRLIMQVLQLTDAQIAMLPREQQASIMELKKQIATPK
jgi:hypothetical protein